MLGPSIDGGTAVYFFTSDNCITFEKEFKQPLKKILCVQVFSLHACPYTSCVHGAQRGQKRTLDPLEVELTDGVSHDGYWEPTLSPWEEQLVFLTAEPSLAP